MDVWQMWLIAALVFILIEIFTAGFAVACLSFGCGFSAIAAGCGLNMTWQLTVFAIGTFLAFVTVRPLVVKYVENHSKNKDVKSNVDSIIGRRAVVTERIEANGFGRVKIDGDDWKARTDNNESAEVGETLTVTAQESVILTVKK